MRRKIKSSSISLLVLGVALGALGGFLYLTREAPTINVSFTYERATHREDGTSLLPQDIKFTKLYCDSELVAQEAGADGEIIAELTAGHHVCYSTHVDKNGVESLPGNIIRKFVEF